MSVTIQKYPPDLVRRWPALVIGLVVFCSGCETEAVAVSPDQSVEITAVAKTDWLSVERAMQIKQKPKLERTQAPPITDLIDRLAARTQADPTNAGNWVLLAQSHAFLGDTVAAEQAVAQALRHGADETVVRRQLNAAKTGRL